ncbi:MAG: helix-turn-helix domain-containing protein [Bacteriovoracaceae bacterium]
MSANSFAKIYLQYKYKKILQNNQRYSLRAFAGKLGISPSTISLIMTEKRSPSIKQFEEICGLLENEKNAQEIIRYFKILKREELNSKATKIERNLIIENLDVNQFFFEIEPSYFPIVRHKFEVLYIDLQKYRAEEEQEKYHKLKLSIALE